MPAAFMEATISAGALVRQCPVYAAYVLSFATV